MMAEHPLLTPRQLVDGKLTELRVTPVDFARQKKLDFAVLHALLQGDYPTKPAELHAIGHAIGAEPAAWSETLAAGLSRLSREDALTTIKGRLWRYLIQHGQTPQACAIKFQLPARVVHLLLSSGVASDRLRQSTLLATLGFTNRDLPDDGTKRSPPNQALKQLVTQAQERTRCTTTGLADDLGVAPKTIAFLLKGEVPHVLDPVVVPQLAKVLAIPLGEVAHLLATSWRTQSSNQGTLKYLVARHCFSRGMTFKVFALRVQVTEETIRNVIGGSIPDEDALDAIRTELQISGAEWDKAVRGQAMRRMATSGIYRSLMS
ncbi:MAG TPA: hypothetical protein VHX44_01385, partial [Planctomycetota bacterium]|nr:hypothetical protein [Planctomycetota bacterium]